MGRSEREDRDDHRRRKCRYRTGVYDPGYDSFSADDLKTGCDTADMLEEVIGVVSVDETILGSESSQAPKAPGMKYRHYAPKAKLTIVEGSLKEEVFAIRQLAYEKSRQGVQVGIIGTNETVEFYTHGLVKISVPVKMRRLLQGICTEF